MKLKPQGSEPWVDGEPARALALALEKLGVNGHYAELAVREGPDAVLSLVDHRTDADPAWVKEAKRLVELAAPTTLRRATRGGEAFKLAVMTGQALPERNVVLFYREGEDFGGFSNFSKHPFTVQASSGREFHAATSEHFFQAMKFWTRDPEFAETILATRSAKEAAELGRDRKHPLRGDWEQIKDDVMRLAVATKIGQHADLASQLLGTSESKLVENAPHDSYWGNGHELGGKGKNRLGEILEEVRAELRKGCLDEYAARAAERIGI